MRRLTSSEKDLLASIEQQLSARRRTVITPDIVEQATHLVRSMTDPRPGLHELVGPVCTTSDIVAWLGISRQGINKAVRTNRILAVQSPSTIWYYPTWQLMANHSVIDDMSDVLGRLRGRVHQLTAASWFQRPLEVLDQTTPAQWMLIYKSRLRSGVQRRTALRSHSSLITNRNRAKPRRSGLARFLLSHQDRGLCASGQHGRLP